MSEKSTGYNRKQILDLIKRLTGQDSVLTTPRLFIDITGGNHGAALLLNQILYWSDRTSDPDGWFYKSYLDWQAEIGLTPYEVKSAIDGDKRWQKQQIKKRRPILRDFGVETKLTQDPNGTPKIHYRINYEIFIDSVMESPHFEQSPLSTKLKVHSEQSRKSDFKQSRKSYNRNQTENTKTKSTQTETTPPPHPPTDGERRSDNNVSGGGGGGELTGIEQVLFLAGVNSGSWKFAASWSVEEITALIEKSKGQEVSSKPAWIVSQLKSESGLAEIRARLIQQKEQAEAEKAFEAEKAKQTRLHLFVRGGERHCEFVLPKREIIIRDWDGEGLAPEKAWGAALNAASLQLHKATFENWLKDSRLILYREGDQPLFVVECKSQYAKNWLTTRLHYTIYGLLKTITRREIDLRFIAPNEAADTAAKIPLPFTVPPRSEPNEGMDRAESVELREAPIENSETPLDDTEPPDPETTWDAVVKHMKFREMNSKEYDTYLAPTKFLKAEDGIIYVRASEHIRNELVTGRFRGKMESRIRQAGCGHWTVQFVVAKPEAV